MIKSKTATKIRKVPMRNCATVKIVLKPKPQFAIKVPAIAPANCATPTIILPVYAPIPMSVNITVE